MSKIIEKLAPLQKYLIVISFLALEVFAFIAFSFGGSFILFASLSLALLILLILFTIKEINIDGVANVAFLFFPLLLYVLLTALGIYSKSHIILGDFNVAEVVFIPIGILSIAVCGYLLSLNKTFKLKHFFIVIYGALALLVFLNLLVNLINFGFFYTVKFKDYYMYYGGLRSGTTVNEMAYALEGFRFIEVRMDHYVLFPLLLLTSSLFLFYTHVKEEKKMFAIYLGFTILGALALILIPSFYGLFAAIIVGFLDLLLFLCKKFPIAKKVTKYVFYVGLVLFTIFFLLFFIIYQDFGASLLASFKSNNLLNRLFVSNRFATSFATLVKNLFVDSRFFGYYGTLIKGTNDIVETHLSGSYLFDNFMTSGLLGNLAFVILLLLAIRGFKKYLFKEDDEEFRYKGLFFTFFAGFYLYSLLFNNGEYGIFYSIYKPIYMTGPFMITIFMAFYIYSKGQEVKIEEKKEEVNNEE